MTNLRRILFTVFLGLAVISAARAGGTFTWPLPSVPPDGNSAVIPAPPMGWLNHFQQNIDGSRKMKQVDLVFDGDSITQGFGGNPIWNRHYSKLNAFDFGISGDPTQALLWRLQNGQVDGLHPKLVVLLIGTNNMYANTAEQIAEAIKLIVQEYWKRCPDATILLQGIFPRAEKATDPLRAKIKAVNQIISQLGDGKKVIFMDFGDKFLEPDGTLSRDIFGDLLHPTAKGYEIWADAIQPVIEQFFPGSNRGHANAKANAGCDRNRDPGQIEHFR